MESACIAAAVIGVVVLLMPRQAHAYLDPSTGSVLLQILVAFLAGTALVVRTYWQKISGLLGRGRPKNPPSETETSDSERSKPE